MKRIAVSVGIALIVATIGCDPFGTDETRVWVTGTIYGDSSLTAVAEGVSVLIEIDPDSSTLSVNPVMTDASGVFIMEIQVYPELPSEENTTGYVLPSEAIFGLSAHYGSWSYIYRDQGNPFVIPLGDTLHVWNIGGAYEGGS